MRTQGHLKSGLSLLGVALLALALMSCGSDKEEDKASSTAPPTASVPSTELIKPGELTVCGDEPSPPGRFLDDSGELVGYDVEIAKAVGERLGLEMRETPTSFDFIIPSLTTGKCDVAINSMFVLPDRLKQVDMIPYVQIGMQFLVETGSKPLGDPATDPSVLCGKAIATVTGSAEERPLREFAAKCKEGGKADIRMVFFANPRPALQGLATGQLDVLFLDSPALAYYETQSPSKCTFNPGKPLNTVKGAMAFAPGKRKLQAAVQKALKALAADGTYRGALDRWNSLSLEIPNPGETILHGEG